MSPDLRLRLHATQAQPCFPAASNALALPGGNGIFTATPAERITHYTLLRKVVCQMGALPPLETPTRKGGTLPLHGAHTAFSCYPALRLYRLSKSPRGIDVVSLTLGNSVFPFAYCFIAHIKPARKLGLSHIIFLTQLCYYVPYAFCVHLSQSSRQTRHSFQIIIVKGLPVTPHRTVRAVFPHTALQTDFGFQFQISLVK